MERKNKDIYRKIKLVRKCFVKKKSFVRKDS